MLVRASKPTVHATKRVANVNSKKNITRSIIARKPLREAVIVNHHGPMVNLLFTPRRRARWRCPYRRHDGGEAIELWEESRRERRD